LLRKGGHVNFAARYPRNTIDIPSRIQVCQSRHIICFLTRPSPIFTMDMKRVLIVALVR
jgi:hypothetical protein